MATHLVMPPSATGTCTLTVNGRTYTTSNGAAISVPDFDAAILQANGWTIAAQGGSGATAGRPAHPVKGMTFADSTLGVVVKFDGVNWRNPLTGAIV